MLLVSGRFAVSQTIIPEAQEHFLTPSAHRDTHIFGGLGVNMSIRLALVPNLLSNISQVQRWGLAPSDTLTPGSEVAMTAERYACSDYDKHVAANNDWSRNTEARQNNTTNVAAQG